jgi:type IV secretion system protein VirB8
MSNLKLSKEDIDDIRSAKNWYSDRYFISIVQRNFLFVFCVICFVALITSLIVIKVMIEKNSIEPYLVEVSENSLIPVSIATQNVKSYSNANPIVLEYFLTRYIKARESYYFNTYNYDYNTVTKVFSNPQIFDSFLLAVKDKTSGPMASLGRDGYIDVFVRQVVAKIKDNTFIFRINKKIYSYQKVIADRNYQITIRYDFSTTSMNYEDAMINPLGIKVTYYEILDERNIADS